jgi:LysR family hydrogen peroxide-inducible transcriptional activator
MITLTQLSYLIAIEKHGSFKKAAKACYVTQPTLSMQLQKLEEDLGVLLFDRTRHPVTPTTPGRQIIEQARVVLRETERIHELVQEAQQTITGEFRLGVIPTLAPYLIPRFCQRFIDQYPKVELIIEESKTEDIVNALRSDRLDAGLLVTPLKESAIVEYPIFQEPFYVYCPADFALPDELAIDQNQLPTEKLLLLREGHCMREQMLNLCRLREEKRRLNHQSLQFESGSIETLINMVDSGHGFTIIPFLALASLRSPKGRIVPFQSPIPTREVSLVVHRSFIKRATLEAMKSSIETSLPAELQTSEGADSAEKSARIPIFAE